MTSTKIRVLACCLALQAACASVPEPEAVKEPPPSEESSATVRPQLGNVKLSIPHYPTHLFLILAVDGVDHLMHLAPVEVPAGPHTLTVGVMSRDWIGESTTHETTISFVAVAARVYQLRGSMRGGEAVVWIVDEGSREVVAGKPPVSRTDTP
jgi:hypothetical protein